MSLAWLDLAWIGSGTECLTQIAERATQQCISKSLSSSLLFKECQTDSARSCIRNRLLVGQEIGHTTDKQINETSKANANNCTTDQTVRVEREKKIHIKIIINCGEPQPNDLATCKQAHGLNMKNSVKNLNSSREPEHRQSLRQV